MEERLAEIGAWLDVNGEAIYGSRRWIKDAQWSAGARPDFTKEDHHKGNALTESTIRPKPGNASREVMFTSKGNTVYALSPGWPVGETLVIRDVIPSDATDVTLLGSEKELAWRIVDNMIEIDLTNVEFTTRL